MKGGFSLTFVWEDRPHVVVKHLSQRIGVHFVRGAIGRRLGPTTEEDLDEELDDEDS